MAHERESKTFLAHLCGRAERHDEMVIYMTEVAKLGGRLSMEESNLLSAAYQKAVSIRRASWRTVSSIKQNESNGSDKHIDAIRDYLQKIKAELKKLCQDIIDVLDEFLIPMAESGDSKVIYHKMRGDYHRYLAESSLSEERKAAAMAAYEAYKTATDISQVELAPTHRIRLGLALNFSVFYYEIVKSPDPACNLAKQAFGDAIAELDSVPEESSRDSILVMELLRHNLTHWTSFDGAGQMAEKTSVAQSLT